MLGWYIETERLLTMESRIITLSPYWFGSRPGELGPKKVWGTLGIGPEFSLKALAPRRETGRSSSLVAGKMERVDCRGGRVGTSESKKLKLKVGDF